MLLLTRKQNEEVLLYTTEGVVRVVIIETRGKQIILGFDAPKSIDIVRKEVEDRMLEKNKQPEPGALITF